MTPESDHADTRRWREATASATSTLGYNCCVKDYVPLKPLACELINSQAGISQIDCHGTRAIVDGCALQLIGKSGFNVL